MIIVDIPTTLKRPAPEPNLKVCLQTPFRERHLHSRITNSSLISHVKPSSDMTPRFHIWRSSVTINHIPAVLKMNQIKWVAPNISKIWDESMKTHHPLRLHKP